MQNAVSLQRRVQVRVRLYAFVHAHKRLVARRRELNARTPARTLRSTARPRKLNFTPRQRLARLAPWLLVSTSRRSDIRLFIGSDAREGRTDLIPQPPPTPSSPASAGIFSQPTIFASTPDRSSQRLRTARQARSMRPPSPTVKARDATGTHVPRRPSARQRARGTRAARHVFRQSLFFLPQTRRRPSSSTAEEVEAGAAKLNSTHAAESRGALRAEFPARKTASGSLWRRSTPTSQLHVSLAWGSQRRHPPGGVCSPR